MSIFRHFSTILATIIIGVILFGLIGMIDHPIKTVLYFPAMYLLIWLYAYHADGDNRRSKNPIDSNG